MFIWTENNLWPWVLSLLLTGLNIHQRKMISFSSYCKVNNNPYKSMGLTVFDPYVWWNKNWTRLPSLVYFNHRLLHKNTKYYIKLSNRWCIFNTEIKKERTTMFRITGHVLTLLTIVFNMSCIYGWQ